MKFLILSIFIIFFTACNNSDAEPPLATEGSVGIELYQISTIDALLAGIYEGDFNVSDVASHGNFGLGTFDGIDGEMIVHNGIVYQVLYTGEVREANLSTGVPFASAHNFLADKTAYLSKIHTYDALKITLNTYAQCKNYPCAFKIHGTFDYIKTRSEQKASKPYPPLAEYISQNQKFFTANNISGTLIGYALPKYLENLNVAGYHFHFISDDLSFGGHVLELSLADATMQLDRLFKVNLALLRTPEFENSTLESAKNDIDKVEK